MDSTRNTIMIFVDLDRPFLSVFSAAYECAVPEIHDLRTMQELCEGICPSTIYCWIVVALQQVCFWISRVQIVWKRWIEEDAFLRGLCPSSVYSCWRWQCQNATEVFPCLCLSAACILSAGVTACKYKAAPAWSAPAPGPGKHDFFWRILQIPIPLASLDVISFIAPQVFPTASGITYPVLTETAFLALAKCAFGSVTHP